jgi:nucleotide-binding universal stress UspA family protein
MARVLVGYDGSDPSKRALAWALARLKPEDEIVLLTVLPKSVATSSLSKMMPAGLELPPTLAKSFEENARERLDEVARQHPGVKMKADVRKGDPAQAFMDAVRDFSAQEVVIGHKSFESEDIELGPVAQRLVDALGATVTVVR